MILKMLIFYVTVQGLTGLKKTDGVNWETAKAIGFLYPNILDTLSYIFAGMSSYSFRAVSSIFRYRSSNPEIFSGSGLQDSQVLFRRWIISCIRPCISLFQYGLAHYPCCLSDTAAHGQDIPDGLSHNYKK